MTQVVITIRQDGSEAVDCQVKNGLSVFPTQGEKLGQQFVILRIAFEMMIAF